MRALLSEFSLSPYCKDFLEKGPDGFGHAIIYGSLSNNTLLSHNARQEARFHQGESSMKKLAMSVALLGAVSGCSSIIEGTSQEILVNTNPPGANCSLERQGFSIARIDPTPGAATIKKTKYDIIIYCNKKGYQEASYINHSGEAGATFGNIVLGGGIGWAVDSAAGADNKYDSPVNITLVPGKSDTKHKVHTPPAEPKETTSAPASEWPSAKH